MVKHVKSTVTLKTFFHCYVRNSCGRYRLLWANFELPGSVNDACIFQAFPLYSNIVRGDTLPNI